jgi:hypothetical protein
MKTSVSSVAFKAATILENTATVVAALLLVWMLSGPFTITRAEARTVQAVFKAIEISLIAAWFAGLLSIASMVLVIKNADSGVAAMRWGWISFSANILVTIIILAAPRVGAIGGPP